MVNSVQSELLRRSHPGRSTLTAEMHNRKLPLDHPPLRLIQMVLLAAQSELDGMAEIICNISGIASVPHSSRHFSTILADGKTLIWERHSEFMTVCLVVPGPFTDPFDTTPFYDAILNILAAVPGQLIRSSYMAIVHENDLAKLSGHPDGWFANEDLVHCDVFEGRASIWSDFRLHEGFGRMLVVMEGSVKYFPPDLAQTLLELGNYRKLALLGLPIAREKMQDVLRIEARMVELTRNIEDHPTRTRSLLNELTLLSARVRELAASTQYRMSATAAYAAICEERVLRLRATPIDGGPTLTEFTQRRLQPAVKTCESFRRRIADLARGLSETCDLLSGWINTELAAQNRDLLVSLDQRNATQLRLQQTVESLSIAAISYYVIGLLSYLLRIANSIYPNFPHDYAVGASVVPIVIIVAILTHRVRGGLSTPGVS